MFVCLCNRLRETECRAAACHPDTHTLGCIYRRLGCRVRCGACVGTMRGILEHARKERGMALDETSRVLVNLAETNLEDA